MEFCVDSFLNIEFREAGVGLKIILDGYSGFGDDQSFNLSISPWISIEHVEREDVRLDNYLFHLLQVELKDVEDIEVFEN